MQQQNTELYKWYIIHTHSGFEAKVINNIKEEIKKKGLSNYFEDFLVPTQKTLEIKKGKKVRQGIDIIGYVGKTGQATGPHVCYRFWKNGKQVDPFKTSLPPSTPVKKEKRAEFEKTKSEWVNKLRAINYPDEQFDIDSEEFMSMINL